MGHFKEIYRKIYIEGKTKYNRGRGYFELMTGFITGATFLKVWFPEIRMWQVLILSLITIYFYYRLGKWDIEQLGGQQMESEYQTKLNPIIMDIHSRNKASPQPNPPISNHQGRRPPKKCR